MLARVIELERRRKICAITVRRYNSYGYASIFQNIHIQMPMFSAEGPAGISQNGKMQGGYGGKLQIAASINDRENISFIC
jgi:hypothetical protein